MSGLLAVELCHVVVGVVLLLGLILEIHKNVVQLGSMCSPQPPVIKSCATH